MDGNSLTPHFAKREFQKHAERFRSLVRDHPANLNPQIGDRWVRETSTLPAKLAFECNRAGLLNLNVLWLEPPEAPSDSEADTRVWGLTWINVCLTLQKAYKSRVPGSVGKMQWSETPDDPHCKAAGGMSSFEWRERAKDYADICELLAELVGLQPAGPDKPDSKTDRSKKTHRETTDDPHVKELARRINKAIRAGQLKHGDMTAFAMDITECDRPAAESLLRQLRRYGNSLIRKTDTKRTK